MGVGSLTVTLSKTEIIPGELGTVCHEHQQGPDQNQIQNKSENPRREESEDKMSVRRLITNTLGPGLRRFISSSSSSAANINGSWEPTWDPNSMTWDEIVAMFEDEERRFDALCKHDVWCGSSQDEQDMKKELKELFIESIKHKNQEPGTQIESQEDGSNVHVTVKRTPLLDGQSIERYRMEINTFKLNRRTSVISVYNMGELNSVVTQNNIDLWRKIMMRRT